MILKIKTWPFVRTFKKFVDFKERGKNQFLQILMKFYLLASAPEGPVIVLVLRSLSARTLNMHPKSKVILTTVVSLSIQLLCESSHPDTYNKKFNMIPVARWGKGQSPN